MYDHPLHSAQEFKRSTAPLKSARSKDNKLRLKNKEVFLTDTQTSDYTKSSAEISTFKLEFLQETVKKLERENQDLKRTVLELKANRFLQVNEEKLKELISETEKLKFELQSSKKSLEQSLIERDFLERYNRNLKIQCEHLTKELLKHKHTNGADQRKLEKVQQREEEGEKVLNGGSDHFSQSKRKEARESKKQKEQNNYNRAHNIYYDYGQGNLLKNSSSSGAITCREVLGMKSREGKTRKQ